MTTTRFSKLARGKGGLVTVGTVATLLIGIAATVFGLGAVKNAIANYDAASWLWSSNKGEVARVNGVTGRADTRYKVSDSLGHTVQVSQTDRYVILRDLTTGKVSVLDLASLQLAASTQTTAGLGVTIALHDDKAFVIDSVQGVVTQLNPSTLVPIGTPLHFPPGLSGGTFDDDGRLWLLVPGEGNVVAIQPTANPGAKPKGNGGTGGSAADDPKVVRTDSVSDPAHDLTISVLDHGVAVLDKTAGTLTTIHGDVTRKISLSLSGPGAMPARTNGGDVPVTVVDDANVYVVTGDKVTQFTVPDGGGTLKPCVPWAKRFYCAVEATGTVYVLDLAGHLANTIKVPDTGGGPIDLDVREDRLFINAPTTSKAEVVDDQGRVKLVDKYANNILGGDPPPPAPPPPQQKPPVGPPGAPVNVRAAAGNAQARVSWNPAPANGAPIMKYVVEGDGKPPHEVGADQRSLDVPGLVNGQQYTFTVYAVNAKGSGPKRAANPVVPTAEVPDPPAGVTATENKDGTVTVTWPAANGQGHNIARYLVSAISGGAPPAQVGDTDKPTYTVPAGQLTYGTQYAFNVIAVNDKGGNSKPSPLSNTVVPYTVPDKPGGLRAVTATDKAGTVTVSWNPPKENGRPITKYVVSANGRSQDVTGSTSTTLTGLGNDTAVNVTVHAVNSAGNGPDATARTTTLRAPKVTVTGSSAASATSIKVNFSVDNGGASSVTCSVSAGGVSQAGACGSITVGNLQPSKAYEFTVTVTNPAGSATGKGTQATQDVTGQAFCQNQPGSSDPAAHTWCNSSDNALELQTSPATLHKTIVGRTDHLTTYKAFCWTNGDDVYAYIYNHDKRSSRWVRIEAKGGQYYTPLAWINIDGNTSANYVGALPPC
jgi:Fibronectin type III domain